MEIFREVVGFIFQSFWTWLGSFLIIAAVFNGIGSLFSFIKTVTKNTDEKGDVF